MAQERLILAIPAGPVVLGDPRHSEGSRLAAPTHRFLRIGCNFLYTMAERQLYSEVERISVELAEFKGADIPSLVARGAIHIGITGRDHVLNLPDGDLERVEVLRELGYGRCEFRLGVPEGQGYSEDTTLDEVARLRIEASKPEEGTHLRIATALPVLAQRKVHDRAFDASKISVTIFPMDGHVENAIRYGLADVIVDVTESGQTMRDNKLIPTKEVLEPFQAVLIKSNYILDSGRQRILSRFLVRVDKALNNPDRWMSLVAGGIDPSRSTLNNGLGFPQASIAS